MKRGSSNKSPMGAALSGLSRKNMSVGEMREWLERKGYEAHEIDECVARLIQWRYLDDRTYAKDLARVMVGTRLYGKRRASYELKKRLFEDNLIDSTLEEIYEAVDERALAQKAADAYLRGRTDDSLGAKQRLARWLLRRGFDFQTAGDVAFGQGDDSLLSEK